MRVFITGATGFIGSAIVRELTAGGHSVLGLARSDAAAAALSAAGAQAHRGELTDTDSLVAGARACEGVIHLAFIHDFSQFEANAMIDLRAIQAMTAALEGSGKPMVSASGTLIVAGGTGSENDDPVNPDGPRAASEGAMRDAAHRGVRASIVRLAPCVHAREQQGLATQMIAKARECGFSAYVGAGDNRWPAVRRDDAAHLFRLALERAEPGARLHAAAEEGVPVRAIAEAIGEGLGVPTRSLSPEEGLAHFGWLVGPLCLDGVVSTAITRESLGWRPEGPGLLEGLRGAYVA